MESKMAGFESAMAELEEILAKLSGEETPLQESVTLYARAAELIRQCSEGLNEAQIKIEEIDAEIQAAALDDENGL